jgi:hypothetical protein
VPALTSRLNSAAQGCGLARNRFTVSSVKLAAKLLNAKWPFAELVIADQRFLIEADNEESLARVLIVIRRRTSEFGCLNI